MLKDLFLGCRSFLAYLFFGVCTTLINIIAYAVCTRIFQMAMIPANVAAWVLAVTFAYLTNKRWVFESHARGLGGILREMIAFYACRIATGLLDMALMYVSVDVLGMNDLAMKVIVNGLVIICNFLCSKLVIFNDRNR